jgi:hypothetical protein
MLLMNAEILGHQCCTASRYCRSLASATAVYLTGVSVSNEEIVLRRNVQEVLMVDEKGRPIVTASAFPICALCPVISSSLFRRLNSKVCSRPPRRDVVGDMVGGLRFRGSHEAHRPPHALSKQSSGQDPEAIGAKT